MSELMTLDEWLTCKTNMNINLNGFDYLLKAIDPIVNDFVANFFDTKIICSLAEPVDDGDVTLEPELQLTPRSISKNTFELEDDFPDITFTEYVAVYSAGMRYNSSSDSNVELMLTLDFSVVDGHIVLVVEDVGHGEMSGNFANAYAYLMFTLTTNGFEITVERQTTEFSAPSAGTLLKFQLLAQGSLASATPVVETVDVPVNDQGQS